MVVENAFGLMGVYNACYIEWEHVLGFEVYSELGK
jgi:hypothetical protein